MDFVSTPLNPTEDVEKKVVKETSPEAVRGDDNESLLERARESATEMVDHIEQTFHHLGQSLKENLHVVEDALATHVDEAPTDEENLPEGQTGAVASETNEPVEAETPSESTPLTEEKSEAKGEEYLREEETENSSFVISQMVKRIGDFFHISRGKKKKESSDKDSKDVADVDANMFLPGDDEVVIDTTVIEDRVSI